MVRFEYFMRMFSVEKSGCAPEQPVITSPVVFPHLSTVVSLVTLSIALLKWACRTADDDVPGYVHP